MTIPRKHHFVPRFYLGGFTGSGKKDGQLNILDLSNGHQWSSAPGNAAHQKDFYMLEFEGDDALAIEKLFSEIEARGANAIRLVLETGIIPSGDDYKNLIDFLAIMSVRIPGVLRQMDDFVEKIVKSVGWHMTASKEQWERHVEDLKAEGKEVKDVDWEKMRDFARSDDYNVAMNQNWRMGMMLEMMKPAFPALAARKWTLVTASDEAKGFICSDRPMSLCWNDPNDKGGLSPGLGLKETSVMFPLSRKVAMLGMFEGALPARVLDARGVGIFNMWTALHAERFVYSAEPQFYVTMKDGSLGGTNQLVQFHAEVHKKPH